MIVADRIEQGTPEWIAARLGIPTASGASRILTSTGRISTQREPYMHELIAEWYLKRPVVKFKGNYWTERGLELEGDLFGLYEFVTSDKPESVGLVYRDEDKLCACSPDWLISDSGGEYVKGVEVKCPEITTHIGYMLGGKVPSDYAMQVQYSMWITGLPWEFISYEPELRPVIVQVEPDDKIQAALDDVMPEFIGEMLRGREQIAAEAA